MRDNEGPGTCEDKGIKVVPRKDPSFDTRAVFVYSKR